MNYYFYDKSTSGGETGKLTGAVVDVSARDGTVVSVVYALVCRINEKGRILNVTGERAKIEALESMPRTGVHEPMKTGLEAIDIFVLIGRGQAEHIVDDRQTGLTAVAFDSKPWRFVSSLLPLSSALAYYQIHSILFLDGLPPHPSLCPTRNHNSSFLDGPQFL